MSKGGRDVISSSAKTHFLKEKVIHWMGGAEMWATSLSVHGYMKLRVIMGIKHSLLVTKVVQ